MPQYYGSVPAAEMRKTFAKQTTRKPRNKYSRCRVARAVRRSKIFKKARKAQVLYELSRKEIQEILDSGRD